MRHLQTQAVITAGSMTGTAVINGIAVNAAHIETASFQANYSAGSSPIGTLQVQGSNDIVVNTGDAPTHWANIGSTVAVSGGNSGSVMAPVLNINYDWIRIVYTNTSGTGTLNVNMSARGRSASDG